VIFGAVLPQHLQFTTEAQKIADGWLKKATAFWTHLPCIQWQETKQNVYWKDKWLKQKEEIHIESA